MNVVKCLAAAVVMLVLASPAFAQTGGPNFGPGFGGGIGMGLSVVGIGIGLGLIGYSVLSGMARQPEQSGNLQLNGLIFGGLVEGAGIISLILCYLTAGK